MKWPVVLMIVIAIVICTICAFQYDFVNQSGNEVYKLIFQASLSGTVTFCGLFITIANQEVQQRKLEKKKMCPCMILEQEGVASTERSVNSFESTDSVNCIRELQDDKKARSVNVKLINIKDNSWAMNCRIMEKRVCQALKWNKDITIKLILYSEVEDEEILVEFSDVYGVEYKQRIHYSANRGKYTFVSSQPTK